MEQQLNTLAGRVAANMADEVTPGGFCFLSRDLFRRCLPRAKVWINGFECRHGREPLDVDELNAWMNQGRKQ